ncbi:MULTISPECIES: hypothetical protein [Photobacterium]|uniref:hypothetical protein n=1 Tax=Photobacterium TaxID=657 RepID=UPI000A763071|nr:MULTISPECIES: hypothetical protein [Photobacterium]UIP29784.1 hypothetical protein LN341_19665 [Photobacterium sp. TLY01]
MTNYQHRILRNKPCFGRVFRLFALVNAIGWAIVSFHQHSVSVRLWLAGCSGGIEGLKSLPQDAINASIYALPYKEEHHEIRSD